MNRSDVWDAAYEDGFERGLEEGRADAVPPGVEPMPWCEPHDMPTWPRRAFCFIGWSTKSEEGKCVLEAKVAHWVTVKETT